MNKNIQIIIAIVALVLIGGAIYASKNYPSTAPAYDKHANQKTDNNLVASSTSSQPSITVLSPNGDEKYKAGDIVNITWSSTGFESNQVGIYLMRTDETATKEIAEIVNNTGMYSYTIPKSNTQTSSPLPYIIEIRVLDSQGRPNLEQRGYWDSSDKNFTITN